MVETEPKIEEVSSDDSDDEMPELQNVGEGADASASAAGGKINRMEKKTRKVVSKWGLKPVPGIVRVTVKNNKNLLFVIAKPDVHKAPGSDIYVVFGEAKIEDLTEQARMQQAAMAKQGAGMPAMDNEMLAKAKAELENVEKEAASDKKDNAASDAVEPAEKDIELIVTQVGCTRDKAVAALKANNNDIVEAIISFDNQK